MVARIQIRRDTAADWTQANPVLSAGEIGYESDTDKAKIGDGSTNWNTLPYFIYRPTFAEVLSKPTTIAGYGISDAFSGSFANLTNKPTTIAGYGISDAFNGNFSSLIAKPTTLSGYGITDAFNGSFGALTGKPNSISGYGIVDAFDGVFANLTSKPTTISGYGITDAFDGQFGSLTGRPTTLAGYGITDAITSLSFAQLTGKPTTLAGYGITDTLFSGAFSALSGRPTTVVGYGITDAAPLASPTFTGVPIAPTASTGTNTTQIASTAFVKGEIEQKIVSSAKIYVQDTEPSFNAFNEIWIEGDTGSIYRSTAGTSTVPLDSSLVSSSSSNITIPAAGASDTRLSLTAGTPSGTVSLNPPIFLESFSSSAGSESHIIGIVTYEDNSSANVNASSFTRASGNAFDTKIKSFTYSTSGTTSGTTHITLTISGKPVFVIQETNIQAKVDSIIDAAPGALNTLNELAAALGDDANFSTTVTNSLATKAPLAGPALTGTPTAPTAGANTNTTQIATTAFVQQELGTPFVKTDLSVTQNSASGTGTLSYNNSSGAFSYTPPDLSSFLTSVSFASLTGKPTTIAGYGISDAFNGAFSALTGKPTTIAGYGISDALALGTSSTTALAGNTTFSFASLTGKPTTLSGYGITDSLVLGTSSTTALAGNTTFSFASLTGKPTTIAGYGISDALALGTSSTTALAGNTTFSFASLTGKPTTIAGYGITNSIAYTNADIDIGTNDFITTGKVYFANMFSALSDLPNATTYHGMFAHVHATGAAYFAHGGNWIELANKSYITFANLSSKPTTLSGYGITDAAALASPALTGLPTAPTASSSTNTTQIATTAFVQTAVSGSGSYNDAAVDTHLNRSTASSGEVLSWTGSDYDWVAQSGGSGGASVTVSETAPSSPSSGDLWFDPSVLKTFLYYQDGSSNQWVQTNPSGAGGSGGASVSISETAPTSPSAGDLWFDPSILKTFIYYQDGSSNQWVQTNPSGSGSSSGGGGLTTSEKTSSYTAVANDQLIVDCSGGAVTVTLPSSANLGDEVRIIDGTGSASTNNITVARNGHKIEGATQDLVVSTNRAAFGLVYYNVANGWVLTER